VWGEEETIGWVYQYYTPKELRDQARKESQAPRNSYELAFRNQFYTPDYVVRFLVDNTLGRTWYEMRGGRTRLAEQCEYLVRRPDEVFLCSRTAEDDEFSEFDPADMAQLLLKSNEEDLPEFGSGRGWVERLHALALCVDGYERHPIEEEPEGEPWWWTTRTRMEAADSLAGFSTQDLMDMLFFMQRMDYFSGGLEPMEEDSLAVPIANEVRKRVLRSRRTDLSQEERLRASAFILYRAPKDPRELKILDPACGSGHFLLYCFDLLETIYEEAYEDEWLGRELRAEYPDRDEFLREVPARILRHNLHGIDIDVRATQIAGLALWLRAQRPYGEAGLKREERPRITRTNVVCAEPMPGERTLLDSFASSLEPPLLGQLVDVVFDNMTLAGEAGSLLKVEEAISDAVGRARAQWQREFDRAADRRGDELLLTQAEMDRLTGGPQDRLELFDLSHITDEEFWSRAEAQVLDALQSYAAEAANGAGYERRLFADDAAQGFAFVDLCRERFDVVLMNPPFGDASKPSKPYIEKNYPRTKNDVYAAFVERGLDWLHPGGLLGAITSRTGFFLSSFRKWREEIVLKEARPTVVADLGQGVLDTAMVETAAYVLEKVR
jgi:hypothetical protein